MGDLRVIWLTSDNDDCAKLDGLTEVAYHICVRYQVFVYVGKVEGRLQDGCKMGANMPLMDKIRVIL